MDIDSASRGRRFTPPLVSKDRNHDRHDSDDQTLDPCGGSLRWRNRTGRAGFLRLCGRSAPGEDETGGPIALPSRENRAGEAAFRACPCSESRRPAKGDRSYADHPGEEARHRQGRHRDQCDDLQRVGSGPAHGRPSGRLCRVDAHQPRHQRTPAQYRLPFGNRRLGWRCADRGEPRRENRSGDSRQPRPASSFTTAHLPEWCRGTSPRA